MSMFGALAGAYALVYNSLPTKEDWNRKIDILKEEYHKTSNLPRKLKKRKRKDLNSIYSLYIHFRDFCLF